MIEWHFDGLRMKANVLDRGYGNLRIGLGLGDPEFSPPSFLHSFLQ